MQELKPRQCKVQATQAVWPRGKGRECLRAWRGVRNCHLAETHTYCHTRSPVRAACQTVPFSLHAERANKGWGAVA